MNNYYFTFGNSNQYPYQDTYIIIQADNKADAINFFNEKFPLAEFANGFFLYEHEEWVSDISRYYPDKAADILQVRPRLFVDMDGTLAEWRNVRIDIEEYEEISSAAQKINDLLYTPGYFYSLSPHFNVVSAIREIVKHGEIEVYILSCCLPDKENCSPKREKNKWLDKYLPEIDSAHRIFVPDREDKKNYVPGKIRKTDYLLDDYTNNLNKWSEKGQGIKLLNDINSSKGTWKGNQISFEKSGSALAQVIESIIVSNVLIKDTNPEKSDKNFDYKNFDFKSALKEIDETENEDREL